jgi:hypothetical protein
MTPMSDGETTIFLRLVENAAEQTKVSGEQMSLMREMGGIMERTSTTLDKVGDHLQRLEQDQSRGRVDAVSSIRTHIDTRTNELKVAQTAFLGDVRFWLALILLVAGLVAGPNGSRIIDAVLKH